MKKIVRPLRLQQQDEELLARNHELEQRLTTLQHELAEQQRVITQLRQSQRARAEQLHAITDHLPALISYVDQNLHYRFVNASYEKSFGLARNQILGKHVRDIVGDTYAVIAPHLQRALSGASVTFETEVELADGKHIMLAQYVPDLTASGAVQGVYVQATDITDRKRFEIALEQQAALIELSYEPMLVWDLEHGIIAWNAGAQALYGYTRQEVVGQLSHELLCTTHPFPLAEFQRILERDKEWTGELRHITKAGREVVVESRHQLMEIGGRQIVLETNHDITERKGTEEQLRESEARFRLLADNISQFAWIADAQGWIFWYNQRWFDYTGTTLEEMQGWGWQKVHHPDHVDRVVKRIQHSWDTGEVWEDTFPLRSRTGEYRWFLSRALPIRDEAGNITRWFGTNTDITEHLISQQALHEAAEFNRTVLESSQDCVKLLSTEGRLEYMNAHGRELMDIDDFDPFKNQFWWEFWAKDMRPVLRLAVMTALAGEPARFQGFCPTLKGTPKWWDVMVSPVRDAADKIIRLMAVSRDITEEKLAQQEREGLLQREQLAHAQAEAANRTKDEFLAIVSHELRAPLNAMLGWAKILRSGKYKPETLPHALEVIERSARSQQQLIEDLLDSSRIISGKLRLDMQPLDLTLVIEAALDTMRPAAEAKNITFETLYLVANDVITGDPERLQQVVWNLVSNAVKFTPNGGRIKLRLERVDPYLQLTISDTGQGINPEFLPYVFDRFHQADSSSTRRFSGLGLGLALVQHLVELHGGTVNADSPGVGLGADFTIKLPLRAVRSAASEMELAEADSNMRLNLLRVLEGLRILVVDDEADARDLIALMLQQQGAHVTTAASATEALSVLSQAEGQLFDCMVSDIGMPDNDGYELMRRVRALRTERAIALPAIALTAYGRARDRIAALSAGFQMHVPKPVEPTELTMVIAGLLGRVGKGMSA